MASDMYIFSSQVSSRHHKTSYQTPGAQRAELRIRSTPGHGRSSLGHFIHDFESLLGKCKILQIDISITRAAVKWDPSFSVGKHISRCNVCGWATRRVAYLDRLSPLLTMRRVWQLKWSMWRMTTTARSRVHTFASLEAWEHHNFQIIRVGLIKLII